MRSFIESSLSPRQNVEAVGTCLALTGLSERCPIYDAMNCASCAARTEKRLSRSTE